ncbi:MAG TPA: M20/M25/M40 family metallo-hydrolase [Gemmatimonadales bacterium]|jgi:hypothetical protein
MKRFLSIALLSLVAATTARAQTFRTTDSVTRRIWRLGMDSSQLETLAQTFIDSIGPRLAGSPNFASAGEWLEKTYAGWGVTTRRDTYGTWRGWTIGTVHAELTRPRLQNLEVKLLAWSPGTGGRPVEGDVIVVPPIADSAAATAFLRGVRGKFVLASPPEIMCRAPQELERWARPATVASINAQRSAITLDYFTRLRAFTIGTGPDAQTLFKRLDDAGAAGVVTMTWSGGWGVNKIFGTRTDKVPSIDLSCEDYGLVYRLATHNQGPRLRLTAEADVGNHSVPMFNVIATLPGTELPNEYVILGAHLDSWAGATGATDNGTGTLTMLEAARILSQAYPHPRRTIIIGHWGGEEEGTIGSEVFADDHADVMAGAQVVFNQDNGTWRADTLEAQGFAMAGVNLARWVEQLPAELSDGLRLVVPGPQTNPGSDHTSFLCRGVPAFRLQSAYPEYRQYTWHTNRDTFDKIVFDDLKNNATLAAMLAYAASEDPQRTPREQTILPPLPNGQPRRWPSCGTPRRAYTR